MSEKVILGVDPAQSCGWCVAKLSDNEIKLIACGHLDVAKNEYSADMSWDLYNQVKALFEEYNVDEMAIEDYMFKSNTCQGAHLNLYLRGALHMLCRSLGKPYTIMAISNWKSIIAGRSTPTNEMKKFYGKALANKILILEALWVRYNIRFPNHSISNKTKKPIGLKFDMVDAVGITIAYAYSKYNTKTVCNCVEFPSDVGTVKSAYSYNSEK